MEIKVYSQVFGGDLFRIYYESGGEVVAVHFFPLMGTQNRELDYNQLPETVKQQFERSYML